MMKKYFASVHKKIYIGLSLLGAAILYLTVVIPKLGIHISCPFRQVTGYDCPGCGMTRASLALLEGDVHQSFRYNMLVFFLLPLFLIYYILEKKGKHKQSQMLMATMLAMTVLFGVLRNVKPFNWMAPTDL